MLRITLLLIISIMTCYKANAEIIKVSYSGELNRIYFADCTNFVNGSCDEWDNTDVNSSVFYDGNEVRNDDIFEGSFLYDTSLNYSLSSDGYQAIYSDAISEYQVSIGVFSLPDNALPRSQFGQSLSIVNNRPIGMSLYDSFFASSNFSGDDWFSTSYISLQNRFGRLFDSFEIPISAEIDNFTSLTLGHAFLERASGDQLQIQGQITSISFEPASVVNSPSSVISLFTLGIFIIALKHRFPKNAK